MKNYKLFTIISILILTSCVSSKVNSKNNYDYTVLKTNSKYIVETTDGIKIRQFEFQKTNENSIIGVQKDKEIIIDKNKIIQVLKLSAGKTIPLIVLGVGIAIITPAYIGNKPVGQ